MAMGIHFFWVTTLCQWVIGFRRFGTWCPYYQGSKCPRRMPGIEGNVTTQELYTFMFASVAGIPLGHLDPWRWGHQHASKYLDPITQWRSVSYIPANTSELDVVVVSGRQKRGWPLQGVLTPHCRLDFYSPLNSITDYILVGFIGLQLKYFLNLAAELSLNSLKFNSNSVPDWWLGRKTLLRRGCSHVVEWLRKKRLWQKAAMVQFKVP
jgi:hypothetical protein